MSGVIQNQQKQQFLNLLAEVGREAIHNLFPDDFEYYMCSFELVDSDGNTVDFLVFPVNPNEITEQPRNNATITKTAGGITVLKDNFFQPVDISISGTFGRRFKFLLGRDGIVDAAAIQYNGSLKTFSKQIKTGYGVTKVLKNILDLSLKSDSKGNAYKLYFYNPAFGTAYIVEVQTPSWKQSMESNMIWNYTIPLVAVAPLNAFNKNDLGKNTINITSKKAMMQGIDMLSKNIKQNLRKLNQ